MLEQQVIKYDNLHLNTLRHDINTNRNSPVMEEKDRTEHDITFGISVNRNLPSLPSDFYQISNHISRHHQAMGTNEAYIYTKPGSPDDLSHGLSLSHFSSHLTINSSSPCGIFPSGSGLNQSNQNFSGVTDSSEGHVVRTRRRKAGISDEERVCIVCGEPASGYNFDRLTCESCKAFFRRNALKPRDKVNFTAPPHY
ncbi:unnamed protein product [Protopolystoma xenopodis]|uniref:Nuclear receptor domain-containing protein n=1 Tax=Protopolystoma xenopodis TaxID=117903 RepID=A0A448WQ99_9PLAT|nr:unnamed protein product [Protopolystoma xenopodis]